MTGLALQTRATCGRTGLKGPRCEQWLGARSLAVPAAANTWTQGADGVFVARLGTTEFFVVAAAGNAAFDALERQLGDAADEIAGVYPVLREDAGFVLSGEGSLEVLCQVCNVDFAALGTAGEPVVMTSMIGVAVLVVPRAAAGARRYEIWCDPTYAGYLGSSLGQVVVESGGAAGGEQAMFQGADT